MAYLEAEEGYEEFPNFRLSNDCILLVVSDYHLHYHAEMLMRLSFGLCGQRLPYQRETCAETPPYIYKGSIRAVSDWHVEVS